VIKVSDDAGKRRLQFDGTITAGNILTAAAMLTGLLVWGLRLEGRIDTEIVARSRLEVEIDRRFVSDAQRERDAFGQLRDGLRRIEDLLLAERRTRVTTP